MLATRIAATGTSVSGLAGRQTRADHRALVLAEQPLDPLQRDRIDVPDVAMDQRDALDMRVIRRVEAVIHARGQPQRDEASVAVLLDQRGIAEQIEQRIGRALDLEQLGVARSGRGRRRCRREGLTTTDGIRIERPQARLAAPG